MHWLWLGFFGLVAVLLLLQRKMFTANRTAAYSIAAWFVVGLSFVVVVYPICISRRISE